MASNGFGSICGGRDRHPGRIPCRSMLEDTFSGSLHSALESFLKDKPQMRSGRDDKLRWSFFSKDP
jgi:hypothetical protein